MENKKLAELYKKYKLEGNDTFKHKHYNIITRQGIDKIQAFEKINISYDVVKCEKDFAVVKATATVSDYTVQTFGSALYGGKTKVGDKWVDTGTTQSWYLMEIAEKRAMSRAVLKLTGFYELGVFGEDESDDFTKDNTPTKTEEPKEDNRTDVPEDQTKAVLKWAIAKKIGIKEVETIYRLTAIQKAEILKGLKTSK